MAGKVGDQIRVESEKVGRPPRVGEIVEVIKSPSGLHYVVRLACGTRGISDQRAAAPGSSRPGPEARPKAAEIVRHLDRDERFIMML